METEGVRRPPTLGLPSGAELYGGVTIPQSSQSSVSNLEVKGKGGRGTWTGACALRSVHRATSYRISDPGILIKICLVMFQFIVVVNYFQQT